MVLNDLDELRTFVLVVDAGGFSAAARSLGVSTNAVSRRIMRLESSLGTRLLHRSTRAVTVTHEGRKLHAHARRILDELAAARLPPVEPRMVVGAVQASRLRLDRLEQVDAPDRPIDADGYG